MVDTRETRHGLHFEFDRVSNAFAPIGPAPVVVGSKFTVTNTTTGSARFYELRKP